MFFHSGFAVNFLFFAHFRVIFIPMSPPPCPHTKSVIVDPFDIDDTRLAVRNKRKQPQEGDVMVNGNIYRFNRGQNPGLIRAATPLSEHLQARRDAMPKMGLEAAGLLQDGVISVEKLSAMAEAEAPKKSPRSTHEQKQQFQIGTDKPKRESQIGNASLK